MSAGKLTTTYPDSPYFLSPLARMATAIRRYLFVQRAAASLRRLPDHTLEDIGVPRHRIAEIVSQNYRG